MASNGPAVGCIWFHAVQPSGGALLPYVHLSDTSFTLSALIHSHRVTDWIFARSGRTRKDGTAHSPHEFSSASFHSNDAIRPQTCPRGLSLAESPLRVCEYECVRCKLLHIQICLELERVSTRGETAAVGASRFTDHSWANFEVLHTIYNRYSNSNIGIAEAATAKSHPP